MTTRSGTGRQFDYEFTWAAPFDSVHVLLLKLKLCLQKVPRSMSPFRADDGTQWDIQDWKTDEWLAYKQVVSKHALQWDDRFVLIAPDAAAQELCQGPPDMRTMSANATRFVQDPGDPIDEQRVQCRFELTVQDSPSGAHHTLRVVRLDDKYGSDPHFPMGTSPAKFGGIWDSADGGFEAQSIPDDLGKVHLHQNLLITHEIGHLLGEMHIGTLMGTKNCTDARSAELDGRKPADRNFQGGDASEVCYGALETAWLADNIMGVGARFDPLNAQPWVRTMVKSVIIARTWPTDWRAVVKDPIRTFP